MTSKMTRVPTIAELRKEAMRVFGPDAGVTMDVYDTVCIWGKAADHDHAISGPRARQFALAGLRSLPSAPTTKKRKGAKR